MPSIPKSTFEEIDQLIIKSQYLEALKKIETDLKIKGISKEDKLRFLVFKGRSVFYLGKFQEAIELADSILKESEGLNSILIQLDALIFKAASLLWCAKLNECVQIAEIGLNLIPATKIILENDLSNRKAFLLYYKGASKHQLGYFDEALRLYEEAHSIVKETGFKLLLSLTYTNIAVVSFRYSDIKKTEQYLNEAIALGKELDNKLLIALNSIFFAYVEESRKEFDKAIELFELAFKLSKEVGSTLLLSYYGDLGTIYRATYQLDKAIECHKESIKHSRLTWHLAYTNIGYVHFLKYELKQALENYLKALEISKKIPEIRIRPGIIYNLIILSIELKKLSQAKQYLDELQQLNEETGIDSINWIYRFSSVMVLKASGEISELSQAVDLLKELLQEQDLEPNNRLDILYSLLEIRLMELQLSPDKDSLDEFRKQVIRLEVEAKEQKYLQLLVNVCRVESQLELIELDIKKAIESLDKAQVIADEINIELLHKALRDDREKIERQLVKWNELREQKAPLSKTVNLVSLANTLENIKRDTVIEERDKQTGKIIEYRKLFVLKI